MTWDGQCALAKNALSNWVNQGRSRRSGGPAMAGPLFKSRLRPCQAVNLFRPPVFSSCAAKGAQNDRRSVAATTGAITHCTIYIVEPLRITLVQLQLHKVSVG